MDLKAGRLLVASMLAALAAPPAFAQLDDEVPHASYYLSTEAFYAGDYRDAERELRRETRRGIRTTQTNWIDSICYHAMLGEVLYHEGRNAEALGAFDQACQLLLAYPNWLLQVKFQQPPRPDPGRARRVPPWATSQRQFVLAQLPRTEQVLIGDLNPSRALQEGGVYRTPMLWRINVVEVVRASALAIRRRNELLGPLAANDPITRELAEVLGRGNLAPANHWSGVWIDLLRGIAQAGMGRLDEAQKLLSRAIVIDGQFDYPLTCVALLEQGRIAMHKGDHRLAAQLLADAHLSAFLYDNWDVLGESVSLGWLNHLASGTAGIYPLLEPVGSWAQVNRLQHIAVKLRLAQAESLIWLGEPDPAAAILDDVGRRIGDMRGGLPGVQLLYVQAALQMARGQFEPAGQSLEQAFAAQVAVSLRNFQIARTNEMYDAGAASPRVATSLYASLLADPTPADWVYQPLDSMAVMRTAHDAAFDRWFVAALTRKETPLALQIAELTKRRRFLSAQPLGGRLLALRTILEAPESELSREALLQRQQLFIILPNYRVLAEVGQKLAEQLRASPILAQGPAEAKALDPLYGNWDTNTGARQQLLAQLALRRLPTTLEFPPVLASEDLQKALAEGEALVVFHAAAGNLYGFLLTNKDTHLWQLSDARRLRTVLGEFLRALGNYGPNRELTIAELQGTTWRKPAVDAFRTIFADARLDLAKTTALTIVPDDMLWYLPFDTLLPAAGANEVVLSDRAAIRYGPTAALALPSARPLRRPQHTGIVAHEPLLGELLPELEKAVAGPILIPSPLTQPANLVAPLLDSLIVFDEVTAEQTVYRISLLPRSRTAAADSLRAWVGLPYGGPEQIVLTGFATAAEQGLKPPRRSSRGATIAMRPGGELFQSLCSLMADGSRTILFTRWRTGGRTNFELVREFVQESSNIPATEAWQRACLLAREAPIDIPREPRLKRIEVPGEPPTADHPFFWAGYLLVDTSPRMDMEPAQPADPADVPPPAEGAPAPPTEADATPATDTPLPPPEKSDVERAQPVEEAAKP